MIDSENTNISKHAVKRIRERLGLPKKAAIREAEKALGGLKIEECGGRLRRYLDSLRHLHGDAADYRVTPHAVYAFKFGVMTTVFQLPHAHRRSAKTQWRKYRIDSEDRIDDEDMEEEEAA